MKKIFLPLIILFIVSCGGGEQELDIAATTDVQILKTELSKQKKVLREAEKKIEQITNRIGVLDPASKVKKRRLVKAAPLQRKDFERFIEMQGNVEIDKTGYASSEMGGRITQLTVREGDFITEGQLIAVTDGETMNRNIDEIRKALELATTVYEKRERLWRQNIGTEIEYLAAKNEKERIEKSIVSAQSQLGKVNVYAPMTGIVDRVMVNQGEVTGPGTPIIQILKTGRVKVVADLPEIYLRSIKVGDRVEIQFPALGITRTAPISSFGRTINANNRTFQAEAYLSNSSGRLKPNLMALMLIKEFSAKNAIVLPTELIQQDVSGKDYIYIKSTCGTDGDCAKKVFIETGENYEAETQIIAGLEGEEIIITAGGRSVTDGELIKILETKTEG